MTTPDSDAAMGCLSHLDRFFDRYPDPELRARSVKMLNDTVASGQMLSGDPAGWAAGLVYAMANDGRSPCGMPGFLNADFQQFFGISMSTIRRRAGHFQRILLGG